jgi:hypothetical protein
MWRFIYLLWTLLWQTDDPAPDEDPDDPEPDPDDDDEIRDPEAKIRAQEAHIARLHKKIKKQDGLIEELQSQTTDGDALRSARIETAFLRSIMERTDPIADVETAWDLANIRHYFDTVAIDDDGQVTGMPEVLDRLVARYPYLQDDMPEDDVDDPAPRPTKTGRRVRKDGNQAAHTRAGMQDRFPALRGRR